MTDRYQTILLFGPPGVGKGTQGRILSHVPGFVHLATGDIFRALDPTSELGRQFRTYSSRGELVPDELTMETWQQHVRRLIDRGAYHPAADLLVLDGMPRNVGQARAIDALAEVRGIILLSVSDTEELFIRMKRRAEEEGRHDDADEQVIRRRFEVYAQETTPVLAHYDPSLTHRVDAIGTPAEVLLRVLQEVVPIQRAMNRNGA